MLLPAIENLLCVGCCKHNLKGSESSGSKYRIRDGLYQSVVALVVLVSNFNAGLQISFATILYPQLNITKYENAWLASMTSIGMMAGPLLMGPMLDKIGRKKTSIFTSVLAAASWAMTMSLPEHFDLNLLYIIRVIGGFSLGMVNSGIVYTAELTNKHWRAGILASLSIFSAGGFPLATVVGTLLPWRSYSFVNFLIFLLNAIMLLFVPESPQWLMRSSPKRAKQILMTLNKNKEDFKEEWEALEAQNKPQDRSTHKITLLLSPEVRRPMMLLAAVFLCQQLSGGYLLMAYTLPMLKTISQSASSDMSPASEAVNATNLYLGQEEPFSVGDLETFCFMAIGFLRVVMACLTVLLASFIDKKRILISSAVGSALSAFAFATTFSGFFGNISVVLPLFFIMLFLVFQAYGTIVLPWALIGELFPPHYRAKGGAIITTYAYCILTILYASYPYAVDLLGLFGMFIIFGVVSTFTGFLVYFFIPETYGKSFAEIGGYFK